MAQENNHIMQSYTDVLTVSEAPGHEYRGILPITVDNLNDTISIDTSSLLSADYNTVADMKSTTASTGSIVETHGFYNVNDGGACTYQIVDSIGSNDVLDMNVILLNNGKYAKALLHDIVYPEQIGYTRFNTNLDLTAYLKQIVKLGFRHIKLGECYSDNYPYRMKTTFGSTTSGNPHSADTWIEGCYNKASGYATRILWLGADDAACFILDYRNMKLSRFVLLKGNTPRTRNSTGILFRSGRTNTLQTVVEDVHIQNFDYAIRTHGQKNGGAGYQWHLDFSRIACAANNVNVCLEGETYCTTFHNSIFYMPNNTNIIVEAARTTEFDSCNFAMSYDNDTLLKVLFWETPGLDVNERLTSIRFQNCNFEIEEKNAQLPTDNKHCLLWIPEDDVTADITYEQCLFIVTPLARYNIYGCRFLSPNSRSSIHMIDCQGPIADVYQPSVSNIWYSKDYDKFFFDETRNIKKAVGSITLENCHGISDYNFYGDDYLPCIVSDRILCSNSTNLNYYENLKEGQIVYNIDNGTIGTFFGNSLKTTTSVMSNVVRIGNNLYPYVVINGIKWITVNLNERFLNVRQQHQQGIDQWCYYKRDCLDNIEAILPTGWRIPTYEDFSTLINNNTAESLQGINYNAFPNATNSTGFNAPDSYFFNMANAESDGCYLWCSNRNNMFKLTSAAATLPVEEADAALCVRVCADV